MSARRSRVPSKQQVRVLAHLLQTSAYGYDMMKDLGLGPGTLYGLLKRLFDEGYVEKETEIIEGRCRISYTLTTQGKYYAERALIEHEYEEGIKAMEES
ncbi:MAG: helix-turn-helix transcriptional regulator [Trueperaceae bacterium]|nr:helix-turn-helix transcriptional regulator [Trueperaceae bacterium]